MKTKQDPKLREILVQWVTDYKDVAERNALAETPEESAEYLLSLIGGVRKDCEACADGFISTHEKATNAVREATLKEVFPIIKEALKLIKSWHNMGADERTGEAMWELYQHSPEMNRLTTLIEALKQGEK